jgi:hypothetical protein
MIGSKMLVDIVIPSKELYRTMATLKDAEITSFNSINFSILNLKPMELVEISKNRIPFKLKE